MSEFSCPVVRVTIEPHPNADAIEIALVGDYRCIVKKGQFTSGDLAVYLPEDTLLPQWLLRQLGFWNEAGDCGTLNGPDKNRIKAIKLRGVLSQGVLMDGRKLSCAPHELRLYCRTSPDTLLAVSLVEGADAAEHLDVRKYEPIIPAHMAGKAIGANANLTHNYDFENIKKRPDLFEDGEEVVITEKIHGTLMQICLVPASQANDKFYKGRVIITSKGLGGRGIILDHNDMGHVYARVAHELGLLDKMLMLVGLMGADFDAPIVLFGEVYGAGVQDLNYASDLQFRAFDLCKGVRGLAQFAGQDQFAMVTGILGIRRVPLLYRGPFGKEVMQLLTDGQESVSGTGAHIREGVVVKAVAQDDDGCEVPHPKYGRKIAKSISEAYLLRKNATEFT